MWDLIEADSPPKLIIMSKNMIWKILQLKFRVQKTVIQGLCESLKICENQNILNLENLEVQLLQ